MVSGSGCSNASWSYQGPVTGGDLWLQRVTWCCDMSHEFKLIWVQGTSRGIECIKKHTSQVVLWLISVTDCSDKSPCVTGPVFHLYLPPGAGQWSNRHGVHSVWVKSWRWHNKRRLVMPVSGKNDFFMYMHSLIHMLYRLYANMAAAN